MLFELSSDYQVEVCLALGFRFAASFAQRTCLTFLYVKVVYERTSGFAFCTALNHFANTVLTCRTNHKASVFCLIECSNLLQFPLLVFQNAKNPMPARHWVFCCIRFAGLMKNAMFSRTLFMLGAYCDEDHSCE